MSLRVLLLGGSLARPSHTSALLVAAASTLDRRGAAAERWDVAERPMPCVDPAQHAVPVAERLEPGRSLARAAARADAVVLASPQYHNSYSGVIKNALDHLSAAELRGKPVALLGHGGRWPSSQALDHLRLVTRALAALAIPSQVITVDDDWALDGGEYRLVRAEIDRRLEAAVDELLAVAALVRRPPTSRNGRRAPRGALRAERR